MFPSADIPQATWGQLKRIGLWWSEYEPHHPHPKEFVDPFWDQSERERVINFLKESYSMPYIMMGVSWCRFECGENNMGCLDLTDGTWLYPEGYAHYIEHHDVKPPEAFLEHLRSLNFHMPVLPTIRE